MLINVLAVDPGKATGWVHASVDTETLDVEILDWDELDRRRFLYVADRLIPTETAVVVCEGWKPRGGAYSPQPDALEIIGVLRHRCEKYGVRFVIQHPPEATAVVAEARAKHPEIGKGRAGHAWMALGHLYAALARIEYYVEEQQA